MSQLKEMYETRAKQQDQVIDTMNKTMAGMLQQIASLTMMMSAFMSQTQTKTNEQTHDKTSVEIDNTATATNTPTAKPHVNGKKAKTTHAVNNNDITKGTPRIGGYFAALNTTSTPTHTPHEEPRETDASMDPEAAFSALTSTTQPVASSSTATSTSSAVKGKRHRNGSDADDDTTPNTSTTRQKSSRSQKGKDK